ncbi:DUF6233 domain-containing protein [Streptomyces sp. GbtcB6]|uniref:DUF6233 domain-containing protein n=1 Tax=Streptomyces sp. GbtcB6 TaxID=2824751 RepID=UPI001C30A630|nr:DUF6233 domain-containing protein [Streptomyces sp. GbtcB6]
MSELLPPDPARLRVILAHLDKQMADHETVGTYLRLQHDAVQAALSRAERRAIPKPVISAPKRPTGARRETSGQPSTGYVVERNNPRDATAGAVIHAAGCDRAPHDARPAGIEVARKALANDPRFFTACEHCRPDTELGIDVA